MSRRAHHPSTQLLMLLLWLMRHGVAAHAFLGLQSLHHEGVTISCQHRCICKVLLLLLLLLRGTHHMRRRCLATVIAG